MRLQICFVLLAILIPSSEIGSAEPDVAFYGQRKLRASGLHIEPILAVDHKALVCDVYGEITVFDLVSGEATAVDVATVPNGSFVADRAFSRTGDLFALAIERRIEIRKTESPAEVFRTFELPIVDLSEYFSKPTAWIEFNATGNRLVAFDEATDALISIDVESGASRVERENLEVSYAKDIAVASRGDVFLLESEMLHQLDSDGRLLQYAASNEQRFQSLAVSGESLYIVCDQPSETFFGPSRKILREYSLNGFEEKQNWECDSETIVVLAKRPLFLLDGTISEGAPDGSVRKIVECPEEVGQLFASIGEQYLLGEIASGLRYWRTDNWEPDPWFREPQQGDQILAVNDAGELTALTDAAVFGSTPLGGLVEGLRLPTMLNKWGHRSLAADGRSMAFLTPERDVCHMVLGSGGTEAEPPQKLALPNNGRPSSVCISEDGSAVAVRFDPMLSLDDPASEEQAMAQAFQSGATSGLLSELFGVTRLSESCAIFELPTQEPIVGLIGRDAFLVGGASPYLNDGHLQWVSKSAIGSWSYRDEKARPRIRRTTPGEVLGLCAFNGLGDVIVRKINDNDPEGILARIFWYGAKQKRPIELAVEKQEKDEGYVAALAADGKHVFLGKSSAYQSTITKVLLPEKKVLWTVELPARLLYLRLSPNGEYLGAKLSDSRYAVLSKLDR